jgi:hypothetical protein
VTSRISSSVLIISKDEALRKRVYSIASSADVGVRLQEEYDPSFAYTGVDVVFAHVVDIHRFKDRKDSLIVILPGAKLVKILEAGYSKFLFNTENDTEILSAFYLPAKEDGTTLSVGDFRMNFTRNEYFIGDTQVYVSPGEVRYLKKRFLDKVDVSSSTCRVALHRLRKRHGKDFLA